MWSKGLINLVIFTDIFKGKCMHSAILCKNILKHGNHFIYMDDRTGPRIFCYQPDLFV